MIARHGYGIIENQAAYDKAIKRNIIANANKTWYAKTERASEIDEALNAGRTHNAYGNISGYVEGFIGSMAEAYDKYGKLTEKQSQAILKGIDATIARKAEWANKKAALDATRTFLGVVGQKITLTLKVVHIVMLDSSFGTIYINICEDSDKNIIIYKGNAKGFPDKDETATVIATVKDHGVRNGVKQTVIQRPKVVKELVAA